MTKGASFLSMDPQVYDKVATAIVALGGARDDDSSYKSSFVVVNGFMFLVREDDYGETDTAWNASFEEGVEYAEDVVDPPDVLVARHLYFDCRSEVFVASLCKAIAARVDTPLWVMDHTTLWNAATIDPKRLKL